MGRADVLMRKIRDDIAIINGKTNAKTSQEIDAMESALMDLTQRISALGDIPVEELTPHKEEIIGIMGMMDSLASKIEAAKESSREAILDVVRKIKAQSSYTKKD